MDKEVNKLIKKLEKEKQQKINIRNQMDTDIAVINEQLKELNAFNNQAEKLEQTKIKMFEKFKSGGKESCQNIE